jgi:hypothetical protein
MSMPMRAFDTTAATMSLEVWAMERSRSTGTCSRTDRADGLAGVVCPDGDVGCGPMRLMVFLEVAADGLLGHGAAEEPFDAATGRALHLQPLFAFGGREENVGEGLQPNLLIGFENLEGHVGDDGRGDGRGRIAEQLRRKVVREVFLGGAQDEAVVGGRDALAQLLPTLEVDQKLPLPSET